MAIRPSYKLEPSTDHGLIEVERTAAGVNLAIHDAGTVDGEPVFVGFTCDEAAELAAMLRAMLGTAAPDELAALTEAQAPAAATAD